MDPITIGIILMASGGGINALGAYRKGQAEKKLAEMEAKLAEQAAEDARIRGDFEAGQLRMDASKQIAEQRAAYAHAGVDVDSGTPVDIQVETAAYGELEAQVRLNNAAREAWGYKTQAEISRYKGRVAAKAGEMGALGSILGTGGSILMAGR